jgi:hypothetical protein
MRTAFVYLVAAFLVGILLAAPSVWSLQLPLAALNPIYFQLFIVGWITQLIFAVANWMFPVFTREAPRGSTTLGWTTYALLNAGLLLRVLGEAAVSVQRSPFWSWLLVGATLLQLLAGVAFAANTWGRVKGR